MRFAVGLSAIVIVLGLLSVVLNLHHLGLVILSLLGIGFALVPLMLLRAIAKRGLSPDGVRMPRSRRRR